MASSQEGSDSAGAPRQEEAHIQAKRHTVKPEAISSWGALVAATAAAIGLFFTAHSVAYQAQQTQDQNATNYMQLQDENKAQARLVNIWPANEFTSNNILITVSNRSEEPVYEFRLYIAMIAPANHGYLAVGEWSSFPPCTQGNVQSACDCYVVPRDRQAYDIQSPASAFRLRHHVHRCEWPSLAPACIKNSACHALA